MRELLGAVAREAEGWKPLLQVAAALGDPAAAARYVDRAIAERARVCARWKSYDPACPRVTE